MHEYSIIQALMARVESEARQHRAIAVSRIEVRLGEHSGVEVDLLKAAFETFREGTISADAEMIVVQVPARWQCPSCDRRVRQGDVLICPDCRVPARLVSGDEIFLDRIEMEAA